MAGKCNAVEANPVGQRILQGGGFKQVFHIPTIRTFRAIVGGSPIAGQTTESVGR